MSDAPRSLRRRRPVGPTRLADLRASRPDLLSIARAPPPAANHQRITLGINHPESGKAGDARRLRPAAAISTSGRVPKHVKDDVVHAEFASLLSVAVEMGRSEITPMERVRVECTRNRKPAVNCSGSDALHVSQLKSSSPLDEIAVCLRQKASAEGSRPPSVRLGDSDLRVCHCQWTPKECAVDRRKLIFLHARRSARRSCQWRRERSRASLTYLPHVVLG